MLNHVTNLILGAFFLVLVAAVGFLIGKWPLLFFIPILLVACWFLGSNIKELLK